ncbi:MAG: sugar ABC transporter ATP-binding protein [Clostridiales Family XIII bacterium]|jgi:ribose transport system ATP-binding protein|nr:sugar ABC transporter ATP-binding protein [Clostridiales Family XIII bacterium]
MLELKNISKEFPGVKALQDVSVTFHNGEVHTLLGENGAGKSTLIKVISGDYQPDGGEIRVDGGLVRFRNSREAIDHNIGYVHQEVQVIPESTVAENIILDQLKNFASRGFINWDKANAFTQQYLDMVELEVKPTDVVRKMTVAQKKLIQIARALALDASIIMLDEPTASLTESEAENLFKIIGRLKESGTVVIFVSHKLEEVLKISDRISVLRDGELVGTIENNNNVKKSDLVTMMVGREIVLDKFMGFLDVKKDEVVMEVQGYTLENNFEDISFRLHRGEILGFYGLVGSGRTELAKTILGVFRKDAGSIYIEGKEAHIPHMRTALEKYKIGYVSENRKEEGLILIADLQDNIGVTVWHRIASKLRLIPQKPEQDICREMVDKLAIKTTGIRQTVNHLSGGNQQKVSMAKWLAAQCDILIVDEPTVGVDVGAKEYIHQIVWDMAKKENKAVILISSDMPELIKLARRICVFREGRIVGEIDGLNDGVEKTYAEVSAVIGQYLA